METWSSKGVATGLFVKSASAGFAIYGKRGS